MLGSIIRNYRNAGVRVNVSLCVQQRAGDKEFPPLFVHGGTGLEIHNLAGEGKRELLRQARQSVLHPRAGERFEDIAWKVAAYSLVQSVPELLVRPASEVGMVVPYTCLIAEYLSQEFRDKEEGDVCISAEGEVFVQSLAGLHSDSRTLGRYEA
jgi:hypothetical protein